MQQNKNQHSTQNFQNKSQQRAPTVYNMFKFINTTRKYKKLNQNLDIRIEFCLNIVNLNLRLQSTTFYNKSLLKM